MDEDNELPWRTGDTIVTPDNVNASKFRWEAIKAAQAGTATQEQIKLLEDTDKVMKEAMKSRRT